MMSSGARRGAVAARSHDYGDQLKCRAVCSGEPSVYRDRCDICVRQISVGDREKMRDLLALGRVGFD